MGWLLTIGALVLGQLQTGGFPSHDRLTYGMAGLMSTPIELDLDLTTGEFSLKEGGQIPNLPARQTHGRLAVRALADVKKQAVVALSKGLETASCRRDRKRGRILMSMLDAIPSMAIKLGDRWEAAPGNIGCWTEKANELGGAALNAAQKAAE